MRRTAHYSKAKSAIFPFRLVPLFFGALFINQINADTLDFIYEESSDSIKIVSYIGPTDMGFPMGGALVIPREINNKPVTEIGEVSFVGLRGWVLVPSSVVRIEDQAFRANPSLTAIAFEGNAPTIGLDVFPDNNAAVLTKSVSSGFGETFGNLQVDEFNVDGIIYSNDEGGITIISFPENAFGEIVIPTSIAGQPVTRIGERAFEKQKITSVIIPEGVKHLDFQNKILRSLVLPDSLETAGSWWGNVEKLRCPSWVALRWLGGDVDTLGTWYGISQSVLGKAAKEATRRELISDPEVISEIANEIAGMNPADNEALLQSLVSNDDFMREVARRVSEQNNNNYATQADLETTRQEGLASGINRVTNNPENWNLFTASQIQEMGVGDITLTRQEDGNFVLRFAIEQSNDLDTWTTFSTTAEEITGLPTDKAFVRIRLKD